ncbi:RNA-guided endonuclease InsQ/TnpB family protein [Haloglycomyces albus]|uniref:RNA-guided endonuclease InsQ/TnpB family protein n=1 Tax=Haloglycomyces albus TaxID=526067 RepID=UPI0004B87154|nr:hypothetical protein [Haloglycomyces albus]
MFGRGAQRRHRGPESGLRGWGKYPSYVSLAKALITEAKKTSEREWLAEVSAVVLQQALRDCDRAYKNLFDSLKVRREGPRFGPPRFKRRANTQTARFTKAARFRVLGKGLLRLPKLGDLKAAGSRQLPSDPTSVTVIKTPTGKYFASFLVTVDDGTDRLDPLPDDAETGIDMVNVIDVVRAAFPAALLLGRIGTLRSN